MLDSIREFLDWFIKYIPKKTEITHIKETGIRKRLNAYNRKIFNELHRKHNHSLLTVGYYIVEQLESTVSYLSFRKKEYANFIN